jgi:hypothetical protein
LFTRLENSGHSEIQKLAQTDHLMHLEQVRGSHPTGMSPEVTTSQLFH